MQVSSATPEGDNPPVALPGEVTGGEGEGEAVAADAPAEAEEEVEAEGKDSTAAAAAVDGEPLGEGEIGGHAEEDTEPKSGGDGEGPAGTEAGAEGGSGDLGVPADAAAAAAGGDGGQKRQSVVAAMEKVKDGILGLDFSQMSTESKRNNKKGTKEKPGESSMEPQTKTANESAEAEEDEEEAFGEPFALSELVSQSADL
uniref:Uncharacterized protein n=1 Tax=Chromera velia CCMP2878 TaxID=1169474 RepID=A0A0K6S7A3_9ALVE|eukprot:Cvel_19229.t1-p1 / transcript=Cvel_19229.t1 / gene=Cvel_19229 / organism=Chromera_velia_CCMP2878 / gene_product=hypothetical protein / transcript_product=hypothetical protein / location=Cvel_scaffold1643:34135-36120(-) / protein_length=199 / sequence_SO=supercontig / SO=protein_coding / is_pseudo=false